MIIDLILYGVSNLCSGNSFNFVDKYILSDRLSKNTTDQYDVTISSIMSYFTKKKPSEPYILAKL